MMKNNINHVITAFIILVFITVPFTNTADAKHPHDSIPAFKIARLLVSESIRDREPAGATKVFSSVLEKVYCFVDVRDITRNTFISFVWYYNDSEAGRVTLPVRKGARWRTYSSKRLGGLKGDWRVDMLSDDDSVIGYVKFMVE